MLLCTLTAIVITNAPFGKGFLDVWHSKVGFEIGEMHLKYSVEHWSNDGLMAIFFLLIGLEIERELYLANSPTGKMRHCLSLLPSVGWPYRPCSTAYSIGALQHREAWAFPG